MTTGSDIQIEDGGYTRIHNAILEALSRVTLSPVEFRIVFFLLRKTYGYNKREDVISISQFEEPAGCSHRATITALQNLLRLRIITRRQAGVQSYSYGFNKYIEQWLPESFISRRAGSAARLNNGRQLVKPEGTSEAEGLVKPEGTSLVKLKGTRTSEAEGNTQKTIKDTLKDKEKQRATKRSLDPLLHHPAVVAYRDFCHLTPNAVQRQAIADKVGNVDLWGSVLQRWMLSGWKPGNVSGQLERYTAEVGTNGTAPKQVKVVQNETGEWVAIEVSNGS